MAVALMSGGSNAKEIGNYLDFHLDSDKSKKDYDIRLQVNPTSKLNLYGSSGTSYTEFNVNDYIQLRTDGEGGNLRLYSPSKSYYYEIDAYNHNLRVYKAKGDNTGIIGITLLDTNGYSTFNRAYNAVYNDYAELFPRGEATEPGDIIALDTSCEDEQYVKATLDSIRVVGVHSDEYAYLIGGEKPRNGEDFLAYNIEKYIPVGLAGRCKVKVLGAIKKGQDIIPTNIPGVGRAFDEDKDDRKLLRKSIGFAVENSTDEDIKLVRAKLTC